MYFLWLSLYLLIINKNQSLGRAGHTRLTSCKWWTSWFQHSLKWWTRMQHSRSARLNGCSSTWTSDPEVLDNHGGVFSTFTVSFYKYGSVFSVLLSTLLCKQSFLQKKVPICDSRREVDNSDLVLRNVFNDLSKYIRFFFCSWLN